MPRKFRSKTYGLMLMFVTALHGNNARGADAVLPWAAVNGGVERGAARSTELYCTVCHGAAGASATPEWPSLAGQPAGYLAEQLQLFRAKRRASPEMAPLAASLTDEDIADLSRYFASMSLQPAMATAGVADADSERLFLAGDAARDLPACASCHGREGSGEVALRAPALRAQQTVYLAKQLQAYAQRRRYPQDPPVQAEAMAQLAARLQPQEITALAAWLQALR
jgi:cytochrome c553